MQTPAWGMDPIYNRWQHSTLSLFLLLLQLPEEIGFLIIHFMGLGNKICVRDTNTKFRG